LKGYDEPEILRSQLSRFGPISADAGQKAQENKAVIENILKIEVKSTAAVAQLGAVLNLIGLEQRLAGTTKAKSLAGGKKVYLYRISDERLKLVETIASRRLSLSGWNFIRTHYGIPNQLTSN
jgi:hypothetical protein